MVKILIFVGILADEAEDKSNRKLETDIEKALKDGKATIPWLNPKKIDRVIVEDVPQ